MEYAKEAEGGASGRKDQPIATHNGKWLDPKSSSKLRTWRHLAVIGGPYMLSEVQCAEVLDYLKTRWDELAEDIADKRWEDAWGSASLLAGRAIPEYRSILTMLRPKGDEGFLELRPLLDGQAIGHMLKTLSDCDELMLLIGQRMQGTDLETSVREALVRTSSKAVRAAGPDMRKVTRILAGVQFTDSPQATQTARG